MSELRFYLDENVPTEVGGQLSSSGIDAVTARDLGRLGGADSDHLKRATAQSRMLCTHDQDFLEVFNALDESIAVVAVPISEIEPMKADDVPGGPRGEAR